jgi:DNA-binding transcriptional MocR family regulator
MAKYSIDANDNSFTQVLDRILFNTAISMGARLTYAALVEHYRDNSSCWPSMERLASMVGCCARTIQNHVKELITEGLVTVIKRGCWKRSNEYRLHALVPPRESSERQPKDIRNRGGGDIKQQTPAQPYQSNIAINNGSKRVKQAGAASFIQRELAKQAAKKRR